MLIRDEPHFHIYKLMWENIVQYVQNIVCPKHFPVTLAVFTRTRQSLCVIQNECN